MLAVAASCAGSHGEDSDEARAALAGGLAMLSLIGMCWGDRADTRGLLAKLCAKTQCRMSSSNVLSHLCADCATEDHKVFSSYVSGAVLCDAVRLRIRHALWRDLPGAQ